MLHKIKVKSNFGSKGFNDCLMIQVQDHGMQSPLGLGDALYQHCLGKGEVTINVS